MLTGQREKWSDDPQIIAIVELDMQKLRFRIVLAREAIQERLRELEHPTITESCGASSTRRDSGQSSQ